MANSTYQQAPIPKNEKERLQSLAALHILDTPPEERFDRITKVALYLFNVPISAITLIDSRREWFKSCQGLPKRESERAISFCGHALVSEDLLIIPDTKKDPRFANNPMVVNAPYIRFYAGVPIKSADGKRMGVFCIKDRKPRKLNKESISMLKSLAAWAELELNTHELNLAIHAREEAEIRVAELNEVLNLLHKSLKHDLLNDLTVIRGYIEMYLNKRKAELLTEALVTVEQGANSIRQMSKLEAAVSTGTPLKKYSLKTVTEKVTSFFPSVKFSIKGQGEVLADEAIFSVIENIFRNAELHGKTKRIDVSINKVKGFIETIISDWGSGIVPETKEKLLKQKFKNSGHGLGLYIIKRTIERYGGQVMIEGHKPKGTSVILKLPSA